MRQALGLMSLHDISQLPVMEGENCVGSVSDWSLSQKSLENPKLLDATVSEVMDSPFPMIASDQPIESVVKLLSKSSPAVLVRNNGSHSGDRNPIRHAALHDDMVEGEDHGIDGGASAERNVALASGSQDCACAQSKGTT